MMKKWFSVAEVAEMLGFGETKVRMAIIQGDLRSVKDGKLRRVLPEWVDEYVALRVTQSDQDVASRGGTTARGPSIPTETASPPMCGSPRQGGAGNARSSTGRPGSRFTRSGLLYTSLPVAVLSLPDHPLSPTSWRDGCERWWCPALLQPLRPTMTCSRGSTSSRISAASGWTG